MYNTKIKCTYNTFDLFKDIDGISDIDNITDEEKNLARDTIYRYELLNIFDRTEYNEIEINECIDDLYEHIKESTELTECMLKLAGQFMSEDKKLGLMILFSYDYMYLSHMCISEFLENGKISNHNILKLKSIVF